MGPKSKPARKNRNKNKTRDATTQPHQQPAGQSSSVRTSLSGPSTLAINTIDVTAEPSTPGINTTNGTAESPTPTTAMSSYGSQLERQPSEMSKGIDDVPRRPTRPAWWKKYMSPVSGWRPCRAFRWTHNAVAIFFRGFKTQYWYDRLVTVAFLALFLFGCRVALELVLHMFSPAAAQESDPNCSIVYVTIPGPIITVSLIASRPTDPNHGTYYYSVINGTTEWLGSIAPPTRFSTLPTAPVSVSQTLSTATGSPPGSFLTSQIVPSTTQPSTIIVTTSVAGSPIVTTLILSGKSTSTPQFPFSTVPTESLHSYPPSSPPPSGPALPSTAAPSPSATVGPSSPVTSVVTITSIGSGGSASSYPPVVSASFGPPLSSPGMLFWIQCDVH
ncbi:hypothetical protein P280DRAFT_34349 [Massarina eburnea CBS 473.64]|uniref:Uncharacterized protein n=1 Tax=Massarina eburnea CBS 473.64 TaxID=1395130 RepID=A0A6A6RYD2_9PLEO|nr:hypothetical protein P280DRAFT_34349 [Massarina eburnea CBS 473.64]